MSDQGIGHNELYKMGFDGASIQQMRKLTPEKNARLIEILKEFVNVEVKTDDQRDVVQTGRTRALGA